MKNTARCMTKAMMKPEDEDACLKTPVLSGVFPYFGTEYRNDGR